MQDAILVERTAWTGEGIMVSITVILQNTVIQHPDPVALFSLLTIVTVDLVNAIMGTFILEEDVYLMINTAEIYTVIIQDIALSTTDVNVLMVMFLTLRARGVFRKTMLAKNNLDMDQRLRCLATNVNVNTDMSGVEVDVFGTPHPMNT